MNLKLSLLCVSTIALVSCGMLDSDNSTYEGNERTANLPLANPFGANTSVIDMRLQSIIDEAQMVEDKIEKLQDRLDRLYAVIEEKTGVNVVQSREDNTVTNTAQPVETLPVIPPMEATSFNDVPQAPMVNNATMQKITDKTIPPISSVKTIQPSPELELPVPERAEVKETMAKPTPITSTNTGPSGVNKVRYGVHNAKTRLVFDINGSTAHTMNFDQDAGILTLTLPDTQWATTTSKTYSLSQLSGYEAKATNGGTIVAIAVENTSGVKTMALSNPNRLVIDLMK